MDNELVTILLQIQRDVAATKEAVDGLAGEHGRVTALEDAAKFQKWYTLCIAPALVSVHALLRYFRVNV